MQPLTEQELNAPGGMSTIDGGYMSGYNAPVPTRTPAPSTPTRSTPAANTPTTAPAPAPNVASELERIKNEALAVQGKLNAMNGEPTIGQTLQSPGFETGPTYSELYPTIDENKIRKNQMKMFQAEINATNKVYDEMLNRERLIGTGRLGTQRAQAARGGLIGSDFGTAQEAAVTDLNQRSENSVQAERQAKIGAIMGKMRQAAVDEIAAKRKARQEDATSYINYLTSARERKSRNLDLAATAFLTQDIDPTKMTPDELSAIAKESGLTTGELINQYRIKKAETEAAAAEAKLKTAKTQAEIDKLNADIAKGKFITVGEGTTLYNTETGEKWKNPKTSAPGSGSRGGGTDYLTTDNKKMLLGAGFSAAEVEDMADDVAAYGLDSVISQAQSAGASSAQINALKNAYKVEDGGEEFLSKEYFSSLFSQDQLEKAAAEAGFGDLGEGVFNLKDVDTEGYLSSIESTINAYRKAGYTDKEILKMMQ